MSFSDSRNLAVSEGLKGFWKDPQYANVSKKTLIDQVIRAPCLKCTSLELTKG
jgi:hypothetical protein